MKKIFCIVLVSLIISCTQTSIKNTLLQYNNEYVKNHVDDLIKNYNMVVKTNKNLSPKLVEDIIYMGDNLDFEKKFKSLIIVILANEGSNVYILDNNKDEYIKELTKRNIDTSKIKFIQNISKIKFLKNSLDDIFNRNEKSKYSLGYKRIALLTSAEDSKPYYYLTNEYIKQKKQDKNYQIDQFAYLGNTERIEIDSNTNENISKYIDIIIKNVEVK